MARPLRIEYDGAIYHVTSRGNAREHIYKDGEDRKIFLNILERVIKRYNWLCHAYCLMNNHYHSVIETLDGNLSKGMRQLNGVYTQLFNKRHHRVGHVFQGRYKAILIQKESHLLEVCRYVVLNPIRAKVVKSLEGWKWSSYRATAGIEKPQSCLTTDWILGQFGTKAGLARQRYRKFVKAGIAEEPIWAKVKGQILLGGDEFIKGFISYLRGREDIKEVPKSQRYISRPSLDSMFTGKVLKDKHIRDKKIVEVVYRYGYTQKEVADYLKMHYSTISRLIKENEIISKYKT
ncbi:MAG: transposase [Thermodesulfovibrionales bacterium]|nr:transposase [Thermodesulfovibrionales bacterium]